MASTEQILNSYGWRTNKNGAVVYEGFEHELNSQIPNWLLMDTTTRNRVLDARESE